jgi:hypothetical protein
MKRKQQKLSVEKGFVKKMTRCLFPPKSETYSWSERRTQRQTGRGGFAAVGGR